MRVLNLALLLFLLAGVSTAQNLQSPSDAPGISVIEKNWRSEQRYPSLEEDPLRVNQDQMELERARIQNQRDNNVRASMGLPPLPPPMRRPSDRETPRSPTLHYIYQAKFQNTGTREIRRLVWEYVFFDSTTEREVGRRRYESKVSIRPGKAKTVVIRSAVPPTSTVNVTQVGKKLPEQYTEQVIVQKIEYSDGSQWQRTPE